MKLKNIKYVLGSVLLIEGLTLLLPLICAIIYRENDMISWFIVTILLCGLVGGLMVIKKPYSNNTMYAKEGYASVALSWIIMSIFGALPFFLSGYIPNYIDALFETVSGFTTTGASILSSVEILPKSLLFWRSFTHWIGGMGLLVFIIALLPMFGGSSMHLIKAESPGPSVGKLVPKVKSTAKILYGIYFFLTILEIILLLLGGMDLFEASTITFGTAGTGGFTVTNIGLTQSSPYIQWVITIFMIIFALDFSFYYLVLMKKFSSAFKSTERKAYLLIILTAVIIILFDTRHLFSTFGEGLRHSAFQVASIMSTTGFATTNFDLWPSLSKTILVILMFVGACAGSTGGGMKVSRFIILGKSIVKELKILVHPKSTVKLTMDGRQLEHETIRAVNVYTASYIFVFIISLLIISIDNFDLVTNFTSLAATLNNIGPGLSMVGPTENFSIFSPFSKLVLTINMLIGRLEIFPMLLLFSPTAWRK